MFDKFDFYRDWYISELEKKKTIEESLVFPAGLASIIFTTLYYTLTEFTLKQEYCLLVFSFYSIQVSSAFFTLKCCYYIAMAYNNFGKNGWEYQTLDFPSTFVEHEQKVKEFNEKAEVYNSDLDKDENNASVPRLEKIYMEEELISQYVSCTDNNVYVNVIRHNYIYLSKKNIFVSLILLLLSSTLFIANTMRKSDKEHKVEITNIGLVKEEIKNINKSLIELQQHEQTNSSPKTDTTKTNGDQRGQNN